MPLDDVLDQLAAFEPSGDPVVSLYLNLQADQHGRDRYDSFVRKEFAERLKAYPPRSEARHAVERELQRINTWLQNGVEKSANGLALFACSARDLFQPVQLDAPIDSHRLFIDEQPHLYPLARVGDQFPRYAAALVDTQSARVFVFGLGAVEREETVANQVPRRTKAGGWSQARYQRHVDNFQQQHVKEVVEVLERIVREESVAHVILAGDDVVVPLLRNALTTEVANKLLDVVHLDMTTPRNEVLMTTLQNLRERDAATDRERVDQLLQAYWSGGLGVIGVAPTRAALELGQVDELLITATADRAGTGSPQRGNGTGETSNETDETVTVTGLSEEDAESLVRMARQTSARVRFIEDPALLHDIEGVGGLLRFRL